MPNESAVAPAPTFDGRRDSTHSTNSEDRQSAHLLELEALAQSGKLTITPEQRPAIVAEILHHLMWPYFLNRTPEMREKFSEANYRAFMRALEGYCLREYIEHPEPRLTIDFIKGLHRQFYSNAASVQIKAVDGSMLTVAPGEFKQVPVLVRQGGYWAATPDPASVTQRMETLLNELHTPVEPLFRRYLRFMFDLTVIHPFPDNNGKMALALGDLYLLKHGIHPPYFARYRWTNKDDLYGLAERYAQKPAEDLSCLYPVLLALYEGSRC